MHGYTQCLMDEKILKAFPQLPTLALLIHEHIEAQQSSHRQQSRKCLRPERIAKLMSALFQPFRALGYITENVPFAVQRRGKETFVTVGVGKAWQVLLQSSCSIYQIRRT